MATAYPPVMPARPESPTWPLMTITLRTTINDRLYASEVLVDATNPDGACEALRHVLANIAARHPTTPNPGPGQGLTS